MNNIEKHMINILNKKNSNYWGVCELIVIFEYPKWDDFWDVINHSFSNSIRKKHIINNKLYNENGNIKSFEEQLNDENINDIPYIVIEDGFIVTNKNRPITISKRTVNKIIKKHDYQIEQLYDLPNRIKDYVLVTKSQNREDSIIVFTKYRDNDGRPEMISIERGKMIGIYEVDNITSVYGRNNMPMFVENLYLDDKVLKQGKKIKQWLKSIGVQFSKDQGIALSDSNIS